MMLYLSSSFMLLNFICEKEASEKFHKKDYFSKRSIRLGLITIDVSSRYLFDLVITAIAVKSPLISFKWANRC